MVDQQEIDYFSKHGSVILRGYFADWVAKLRVCVDKLMLNPSPRERSYEPKDGSAPFFQDLCNWQRIDEFRDFIFNSRAGEIASNLMRSDTSRFFHDHVLVKEPGSSIITPWHQDQPYYCTNGFQTVSFWIPLDSISLDASLNCISGSHEWGKLHKPKRFDGTDLFENDDKEEIKKIIKNIKSHILDEGETTCTVEFLGTVNDHDAFLSELDGITVLEVVRSGATGIICGEKTLTL